MSSGRIVQIIGAVIDVEFNREDVPKVYDALMVTSSGTTLEVQQQLGDGVVRTIAMGMSDGLSRGLEVTNGSAVIASLPKVDDEYDLDRLSELVMTLKEEHPAEDSASVLLEPAIEYDHLIQVMDVVRSARLPVPEGEEAEQAGPPARVALFTDISIGDAP